LDRRIMKDILITRDSKGKIRVVDISCEWVDKLRGFVISRNTSQLGGKVTEQPTILITMGKAKRTLNQQATLEYNSHLKKYLDKGYKNIQEFGYSSLDEFNPNEVMPEEVTDQAGALKPMLCKKYDDVATSTFEKLHYCSTKLDGVRCMIRLTEDGLKSSSRGGGDYDVPATYILQDEKLIDYMGQYPDIILDGELYIHGEPLPYISGLCRKITLEEAHQNLKYYIYDIAGTDATFEERLKVLDDMRYAFEDSDKIVICEHTKTRSWSEVEHLHNKCVKEGFEGCIMRNPDKEYGYGKKDNRMIKVKMFNDDEFYILGLNEGLRDEDFSFQMQAKNGKVFGAKPMGSRELRQWYRDNIVGIIGKKGTVKYFGLTPDGIPNLPIFKSIRENED
jgi:ATP-dependent DNA ligase